MPGENLATATEQKRLKRWLLPEEPIVTPELVSIAGSEILAQLLAARGFSDLDAARAFLDPGLYRPTSPAEFKQMGSALARIGKAIENNEKIIVYGDYDADGVTSTCVMMSVLKRLQANVDFYIPNRLEEGYGLNLKAVSVLSSKHRAKLIITCDCGISNFAEINLARSLGVDTIIVDHHSMPDVLPPAVATLHPKQFPAGHPLEHLSGVGVAFKLAEALLLEAQLDGEIPQLLDLVTMGLIADMVPLVQENRYLVQIGLPMLAASKRAGIRALLENTVAMEGSELVGFGLAPRINAVGRLSDASVAVKLLLSEDATEAFELARRLEMENARRQELCEQIFFEADQKAKVAIARGDKALALYGPTWHHGVVGIVASRLVEKYHCPAFVAQLDEAEGKIKGSARSVAGLDLYQVLKVNEQILLKWGGHQMAAGFAADSKMADAVCSALVSTCAQMLKDKDAVPTLHIDLKLAAEIVTLDLAKDLSRLGPFGMGNKKPVLELDKVKVAGLRALGKEGKHHRINVEDQSGQKFECVLWRSAGRVPREGEEIDLAFSAEVNSFNGRERLQLNLCDWRLSKDAGKDEVFDFTPPAAAPGQVAAGEAPSAPAAAETWQLQSAQSSHLATSWDGSTATTTVAGSAMVGGIEPPSTPVAMQLENYPEVQELTAPAQLSRTPQKIQWKDLRGHSSPQTVLETAVKKLGERLAVYAEAQPDAQTEYFDRTELVEKQHLLIWQMPPSAEVFRSIIQSSQASTVYLVGGGLTEHYDAATFLKRLLGIVRFAVSRRDGQAHIDKIAAALAGSKMAVALGLGVLRKLHVVDWYSENSTIFLDLIGPPTDSWHDLPEYQQLTLHLREVTDFRRWCIESPLNELQLTIVPNAIRIPGEPSGSKEEIIGAPNKREHNERPGYITSSDQGQG